jgi:hypothetical protein
MANSRLSVKLTAVNLMIGLLIVLLSLALFSWLLPMLLVRRRPSRWQAPL